MAREHLIGDDETPDVEAAPPPDDKDLKQVADLARQQVVLIREVNKLQTELAEKSAALKKNMEFDLPLKMKELGMTHFGLAGGASISMKEVVTASIPRDPEIQDEAFSWLETKGHGGLIKRRIQILFGRDDIAWAKKFLQDCAKRKKPLILDQKTWVEPQTLMAFVREQLKLAASKGTDPEELAPTRLLGTYKMTYAVVDLPGEEKLKKPKK